jgi:hypothetical protein
LVIDYKKLKAKASEPAIASAVVEVPHPTPTPAVDLMNEINKEFMEQGGHK